MQLAQHGPSVAQLMQNGTQPEIPHGTLSVLQHGTLLQLLFSSHSRGFGSSAAAYTTAFPQPSDRHSAGCATLLLLEGSRALSTAQRLAAWFLVWCGWQQSVPPFSTITHLFDSLLLAVVGDLQRVACERHLCLQLLLHHQLPQLQTQAPLDYALSCPLSLLRTPPDLEGLRSRLLPPEAEDKADRALIYDLPDNAPSPSQALNRLLAFGSLDQASCSSAYARLCLSPTVIHSPVHGTSRLFDQEGRAGLGLWASPTPTRLFDLGARVGSGHSSSNGSAVLVSPNTGRAIPSEPSVLSEAARVLVTLPEAAAAPNGSNGVASNCVGGITRPATAGMQSILLPQSTPPGPVSVPASPARQSQQGVAPLRPVSVPASLATQTKLGGALPGPVSVPVSPARQSQQGVAPAGLPAAPPASTDHTVSQQGVGAVGAPGTGAGVSVADPGGMQVGVATPDCLLPDQPGALPSKVVDMVRELVGRALKMPLMPAQQATVLTEMEVDPLLIHRLGLDPCHLPPLVEHTPAMAVEILIKLANHPQLYDFLTVLARTELSLHSMEVVNRLTSVMELPSEFMHLYITNCMHSCENQQDKYVQNRLVRLVCVFLQSLIRNRVVNITDLMHEAQSFCVNFSRIREAAKLFRLLKAMPDAVHKSSQG